MVCDKVVWVRWCVTKLCEWDRGAAEEEAEAEEEAAGYRIKNKNPAQRPGEIWINKWMNEKINEYTKEN